MTIKTIAKDGLRRLHLKVSRIPRGRVAGVDLAEDLRLAIPSAHPLCFDVGANEGQTIQLLTKALRSPLIHAFEPSSTTFQVLRKRVRGSCVHLHQMALGKETSSQPFTNYSDSCLSSFLPLDPHEHNRFGDIKVQTVEKVSVDTVDNFSEKHSIARINLLKIDTQGYDLEVLHGAKQALAAGTVDNVLVELNFAQIYKFQPSPAEIISYLEDYRFALVDFYEKYRSGNSLAWCTALFSKRQ